MSHMTMVITLEAIFSELFPLELRELGISLKNGIFYIDFFISKGISFILQIYVPHDKPHHTFKLLFTELFPLSLE